MREPSDGTNDFGGVAKDVTPTALPPNLFQTDHGSSRFLRGSWSRRKGLLHTNLGKTDDAVVSLLGFELPGGDYALISVEGTNVHGDVNTVEQDYTVGSGGGGSGGFGDDPFGDEGFGEGP